MSQRQYSRIPSGTILERVPHWSWSQAFATSSRRPSCLPFCGRLALRSHMTLCQTQRSSTAPSSLLVVWLLRTRSQRRYVTKCLAESDHRMATRFAYGALREARDPSKCEGVPFPPGASLQVAIPWGSATSFLSASRSHLFCKRRVKEKLYRNREPVFAFPSDSPRRRVPIGNE
jgi:hypothetical protein